MDEVMLAKYKTARKIQTGLLITEIVCFILGMLTMQYQILWTISGFFWTICFLSIVAMIQVYFYIRKMTKKNA
jgi:hypothetical protein